MPAADEAREETNEETNLVAILLPPVEAAPVVVAAWDAGEAVLVLDPSAPGDGVSRVLERLSPTHLVDGTGRRRLAAGVPVAASTAAVVRTSGTTGDPRGVELTRPGLEASARAVSDALGAGPDDRWLCCLPLHHVAGLAVVARAWATGVQVVVHPRFDVGAVTRAGASLVSLVPTTLSRLLDAGAPLGHFRRILVGGAPLPDALGERALAAGAPVVTTYGLTETWGGIVHDGHPLAGVELCLGGEQDEIEVRGPMVMAGYRLDPAATAAAFTTDGRLRTGDAGAFEPDGRLRVTGRLHDLVVTGGVNVSPSAVEEVLARHPDVLDVCVTGAPDPEWGERVVAHVVPRDPSRPPSLDDLRDFARATLAPAHLPRELHLVRTIPRTQGGKPLRHTL